MVKVIVAITTYNLEKYVAQALDSVLMQKTNFDFKIKVADDCSTDNTIKILEKYKKLYPEKIDILYAEKNMGSLLNSNRLLDHIDCEYFSFLDGDDYWLDDQRLQKQVDFLDSHKEYSMCAGNTQYLIDGELKHMMIPEIMLGKSFSFMDFINKYGISTVVHTSAILFRNCIFKDGLPQCYNAVIGTFEESALRGENFRRLLHLERGLLFIDNRAVSVYRIHDKGIWQGATPLRRRLESTIEFNYLSKYYGTKYGNYFEEKLKESYRRLFRFLITNSVLFSVDSLPSKEGDLLGKLICDISSRNSKGRELKYSKINDYICKYLIKG